MKTMRDRSTPALVGALALAGVLLGASPAAAGPNTGRISFTLGNDFTTAYFFRGILQERDGFITQPYGEVGINLYSSEEGGLGGLVNSVSLFGGSWNSIHEEATLASGGPTNWYESDAYGGIKTTLFGNTEAKLSYIAYTSPNNAFSTIQEIDASLGLDDSQWLGTFAMNPSILVAAETENSVVGLNEGWYMQIGVRPSFTVLDHESYPVSLAVPVNLGLSLSDYFEDAVTDKDETFGFLQSGLVASIPLAFIPEDYGAWAFSAGASVYTFGGNLEEYNKHDDPWVVGTWGISMSY